MNEKAEKIINCYHRVIFGCVVHTVQDDVMEEGMKAKLRKLFVIR